MIKKLILTAVILLSLLFGAIAIIQSDYFREYALKELNGYIEKSTKGSLKIEKIEVTFPFKVVLTKVAHDSISIDHATFSLSLRQLLQGKIQIKELVLHELEIKKSETRKSLGFYALPEILGHFTDFKLDKLIIERLKFEEHIVMVSGKIFADTNNHTLKSYLEVTSDEFSKINAEISLNKDLAADIIVTKDTHQLRTKASLKRDSKILLTNFDCTINHEHHCHAHELIVSFSPFLITGKINGELNIKSSGKASFKGCFKSGKDNSQNLKILAKSKNFTLQGFDFQNITTKALIKDLFGNKSASFTILVKQVSQLSDIKLAGSYDFKNYISLKEFNAQFMNQAIALEKPFSLKIEQNLIETSPLSFNFGTAHLATSFKSFLGYSEINMKVTSFPAKMLLPETESGLIDAEIALSGKNENPTGTISLKLENLKTYSSYMGKASPLQADLVIDVQQHAWQVAGNIKEENQNPIAVKATLPCTLSLFPFSFKFDTKANFRSQFTLDGNLEKLVELYKQEASNLSGLAKFSIEIDGTLEEPHLSGSVEIRQGTFEIPETGALYKNINASGTIVDNQLILDKLTASDAFEGSIKAVGTLELNLKDRFPYSCDIEIENTKLLRLDYANATGNGTLKLTGNFDGALLEGQVVALQAKVRIPEESPVHISTVDVTYIDEEKNEIQKNNYRIKEPWPIGLNLIFDVKDPFSIKGTGLKSKWGGSLKIKGTAAKPEIFGEFKIVEGEYKFNGKIFEINEGTIAFAGEPDKKTSLYVIGSQDMGDIRADVILKGPLKAPAISFRSNPPLPQREILSWILFGHGAKELNAFEGSLLNQSITDLNKGSKGPDLLTKIRNKIGIDTIDFNHNSEGENNEVSVKVGKYISKGILVSINKSFTADANRLEIEAKLFKDIKVQAEIGDDAEGQLNLKWKKDY